MKKGIDVSSHQGKIDWNKVKADGIEFAILRAGFGKNNLDLEFRRNANLCNQVGIPIGVYWYSYAYTVEMARKEAEYCVDIIKQYKIDYPVWFDVEGNINDVNSNTSSSFQYAHKNGVTFTRPLVTAMHEAFLQRVIELGYKCGIYTYGTYVEYLLTPEILQKYDIWFARPNAKAPTIPCKMWQYSWTGKINGIGGNVDMNYCYKDYLEKAEIKSNVPDWGMAAFEKLQAKGIIKTPEYWVNKLENKDLAVYEIMALLANMID